MDLKAHKSAVAFIWMSLLVKLGDCIKCVRCTTLMSRECENGYTPATECKPDMPYCIKYVGKLKSGSVVFRDCSRNNMTDVCTMKMMGPTKRKTKVRVCYETCDFDGCNGGPINTAVTPSGVSTVSRWLLACVLLLLAVGT